MSNKWDIVYGYEDEQGEFVEEGPVEEGLEESYPGDYDDKGLITSEDAAHAVADDMNQAAQEFHAEDLAEGLADPNGPVIHQAVPAEETENERL